VYATYSHHNGHTLLFLLKVQVELSCGFFCEQWMTAGRGIVHCEMPYGDTVSHGLQLWVNLAKKDKIGRAHV